MGQKLMKFYNHIRSEGGIRMQMRLAMKTGLPSSRATEVPDSPENIEKFRQAYRELLGKEAPSL